MKKSNNKQGENSGQQMLLLFSDSLPEKVPSRKTPGKEKQPPAPPEVTPADPREPDSSAEATEAWRDGRDELNLAEFPLCSLADRLPGGSNTLVFSDTIFDRGARAPVQRTLTISGSSEHGLPTASDGDVLLGLIQLTHRHSGFSERTTPLNRPELLKLLRWPGTGGYYERIEESLNRWVGVTLYYDRAWWDKAQQSWVNEKFHVLERVSLRERHEGESCFTWGEVVFQSFRAENLKKIDLDTYFGLSLPTSRRMYRFLDKRFYRTPACDFDLRGFACEHLGLSRQYHNGEIKRRLLPALRELEEAGFLEPVPERERFSSPVRGEWRIHLRQRRQEPQKSPRSPQETLAAVQGVRTPLEPSQGSVAPAGSSGPTLTGVAALLAERGVSPGVATVLASAHSEELIRQRIDVLDWLLRRKDRRAANPAGYLVSSIRDGYRPPAGYQSPAERAALEELALEEELRHQAEAHRLAESLREKAERDERLRQADGGPVDEYLLSLDAEQLAALEADAIDGADAFSRRRLRGGVVGEFRIALLKSVVAAHVRKILARRPSFG